MRTRVLASAVLTLIPALAAVQAGAATAQDSAQPLAVPAQAAAMQRDLGLTTAQVDQLMRREAFATKIVPAAKKAAGAAFGGVWYDSTTNKVVVGLADQSNAAAVRATGATVAAVPLPSATLDEVKASVDRLAGKSVPAAVSGWRADPRSGKVVVDVQAGRRTASVDAFLAKIGKAGPVTVREVAAQAPKTFAAGTVGGDPYYTGNVRCSIGFSVQGGYVTAGHCGGAGSFVRGWDGSDQGTFQGLSFPENDYAWVAIGYGWWTVPVVYGWGQVSDQLVRGSAQAAPGTSICRSGSTSHWHCGQVLAWNETVNYGNGALVYELTKTSVCAEPGDSGGAFISGDQAQGVTSGGWGDCTSGGETWFQPINEILGRYGLTLHTA